MSDGSEESPADDVSDADPPANDEEDPEAEASDEEDTIEDSDIIRLAYTARSIESDQLVDTTDEEIAEEEGIDTEERTFEARVIALGSGQIFPSVESDIVGKAIGDTGRVEVAASESFGEYDPDEVRTVSADTIPEDDRYPGAQVELDGEHGYVETIIGGRARVDFNHPLAGEAIEYEYEILDRIEDRIEQASGLLSSVVDADLEMWIESEEEEQPVDPEEGEADEDETELVDVETLYIESVPQLALNQQWMFRKRQIAQDIIDRLGVDQVIVQETIEAAPAGLAGMGDVEAALDEADVDAEEIAADIEEAADDVSEDDAAVEATPDE